VKKEKRQMGDGDDLLAAEIRNLHWLVSAPKFSRIVIGDDGYPATMIVPDPRAFAVHKLWLSRQKDRDPLKKKRDHAQALAVSRIILQYFPELQFKPEQLRMFPKTLVDEAVKAFQDSELPPGYSDI
jgi:hypothetical protein